MNVDYRLPESVIVVEGTIERVKDLKAETDKRQFGEATAKVLLTVRGDEGAGQETLSVRGGRGDSDFTVELTADQRLTGVSYKSVGVGSRVIAAGATLVATVAGVLLRTTREAPTGMLQSAGRALLDIDTDEDGLTDEDKARKEWDTTHPKEVAHRQAYGDLLDTATTKLLNARQAVATATNPVEMAQAVARAYRLEGITVAARGEVAKVEGLYLLWRESFKVHSTESLNYTLPVDALPTHDDKADVPNVSTLSGVAKALWEQLGVLVEIGPADGRGTFRPSQASSADGQRDDERVQWRVPRPVRLWVWRRGDDDKPSLERSFEAIIVDRFAQTSEMPLNTALFGEQGGSVVFDDLGSVTKISRNDKSPVGAFADAVGAIPASVASGLDSAQKISTTLTALADADAERRLATLKRQVEERSKELELKGLSATAEDFAELKRLEQQVAMATARTTLQGAPETELGQLKAELDLTKAHNELDAAARQRALNGELAATQAEVARLSAELELSKLQKEHDGS